MTTPKFHEAPVDVRAALPLVPNTFSRVNLVVHSTTGDAIAIFEDITFKRAVKIMYHIITMGFEDYKSGECVCMINQAKLPKVQLS